MCFTEILPSPWSRVLWWRLAWFSACPELIPLDNCSWMLQVLVLQGGALSPKTEMFLPSSQWSSYPSIVWGVSDQWMILALGQNQGHWNYAKHHSPRGSPRWAGICAGMRSCSPAVLGQCVAPCVWFSVWGIDSNGLMEADQVRRISSSWDEAGLWTVRFLHVGSYSVLKFFSLCEWEDDIWHMGIIEQM